MSVPSTSPGVASGSTAAVAPRRRNGSSTRWTSSGADIPARSTTAFLVPATDGRAAPRAAAGAPTRPSTTSASRGSATWTARDVRRSLARVGHPDDRDVRRRGDRPSCGRLRPASRRARGSRVNDWRDLVQAAQLAGRPALRLERALEDGRELLRALVQPRVLHRDGELAREGDQEPLLALAVRARARLEDPERPDRPRRGRAEG